VRPNIDRVNCIPIDLKDGPQIRLNNHSINGSLVERAEAMDFMGSQAWSKRVVLENVPGLSGGFLLAGREFIKILPELF
jgi:hypothetical protein